MVADVTDFGAARGRREASRPSIEVREGEQPRLVEEAQSALIASRAGIYQRGGQLVRIVRLDDTAKMHGVERRAGSVVIVAVTKEYLTLAMARAASWSRYDGRKKKLASVNPPPGLASTLLAMSGEWRFPPLTGIIAAPTLRSDGSVLDKPGYDAASGLYADFDREAFPPIPSAPTHADAIAALGVLQDLLAEFEFSGGRNGASAAAAVAAIMTACVRHTLPIAPGYGLNAHKAGSGKTTLGHTIAGIATGHDAAVMPLADDENEVRKSLLAVLMAADLIVLVDNINAPVDSAAVCAALTSQTYKDRVLGESRTVSLPTAATWLFNGNNLEFVGDLTSRILMATLDPQCEQPEARAFTRDISAYVAQHRGELVRAVLTIPLAHMAAGAPAMDTTRSRFRDWDRLVRLPLIWAGAADPLATQSELRTSDPIRAALVGVMTAWVEKFRHQAATVAEASNAATKCEDGRHVHPRLHEALTEIAGERNGTINARRLGRWLAKHLRRIEGGRRFEDAGMDPMTCRPRYRVTSVTSVTSVSSSPLVGDCSAN